MNSSSFKASPTTNRRVAPHERTSTSTNNSETVHEHSNSTLCDVYHTIHDQFLSYCRKIIFGPVQFKLIVAFTIIILGSLLKSINLAPESYLSQKTNILNQYFAKLGWGWTMGLLAPFIYLTLMTRNDHYRIITQHLTRLLVATIVWYIITSIFVHVESYTGFCDHQDMQGASRKLCLSKGHKWQEGHDFSGHTFLLLYAILIINEEIKLYEKGRYHINETNKPAKQAGDTAINVAEPHLQLISRFVRIFYILLAGLTILWEFMLLSTALYFHHAVHKVIAAGFAVFFWYITYSLWYRPDSNSILIPSSPKY